MTHIPLAYASTGDFSGTINWGDGTSTPFTPLPLVTEGTGTATLTNFAVTGSHPYPNDGIYHVTVTVIDDGGSTVTTNNTVVNVADAVYVNPLAVPVSATEGNPTGPVLVATFADPENPAGGQPPVDYYKALDQLGRRQFQLLHEHCL